MRYVCHVLSRLALLAILAFAVTGCGWIRTKQIAKRTNPKYRTGDIPSPTRIVPIFSCASSRRRVAPDSEARRRFLAFMVPALWKASGGTGEPQIGNEPTPVLCDVFYRDETYPPWAGNDAIRTAVQGLLANGERSALVVFFALTYECGEKTSTVRDRNGARVGEIGTGEEVCAENGSAHLLAYLLSADGELIWQSGIGADLRGDATALSAQLFEGFPRDRVTIAAP